MLISADYSQVELRVLAHMSGDESLIETFQRGADIHRATASKMFNIPEEELTARTAPRREGDQLRRVVRDVGVPSFE